MLHGAKIEKISKWANEQISKLVLGRGK